MIFLNDKEIEVKKFPNGESLINSQELNIKEWVNTIKLKFESDNDITHLIFLKEHLDELNIKCNLIIPYMPYSRMDRTEGFTVFTLKHLCRLINNLNFEEVSIYEPHSDVCVALLDRVKVINMSAILAKDLLEKVEDKNDSVYLVYPDAGAAKRYGKQIEYEKILTANKERDFKTGFINKLEINGIVESKNFKAIIVDDLCSKGGTFILTAKKLKEMGATEIYLVVTHCEDTIFDGEILKTDLITKVFTTNSILSKEHEKIEISSIV
ncbi:ribose-phosphate pyrophosphokinase [Clostridium beijerinckii]|uniref:ribose-phosphate diphosphokinase n=1 Tax=Clostridium beijerinckii TaxID=1520 RepID=A0A9Q5GF18_CLOBE|nr:ribose-phosphate pyrophosphokinase [Clostridium beijerinckii]AQS04813.1 ribose-phosphate pyrophosphokinase [Clostridium beijerinckii]MBA2887510.1 ribose-phosphate pyrophosphokinase [Clostridium beijerinckii]MBA2902400.1 ribose-phosphate pyrophosphokinase [Clostridium beijerinckii]MBA2912310.1 ribose-phosphate pyrophosphokinase [Clostridium beijerinckii]MBA9015627.1 ribose-phosphate pyrophosphokinase [Clostridium beijerinckii]